MSVSPSFFAVPIEPAAVELLAAVAPVLDRWGRWYVFGAQAVSVYGVPRLSADVDVTLALSRKTTSSPHSIESRRETRPGTSDGFARRERRATAHYCRPVSRRPLRIDREYNQGMREADLALKARAHSVMRVLRR